MACDEDMRRLMEQLFPTLYYRFASNFVDIARPAPFVPSESVTNDFFESMKIVLFTKRLLILKRWGKYFGISCLKAFSSHEMYLRYVMFACEIEAGFSDDIFDVILNVCALILTFMIETLNNTGLNFCDLSVDVFMGFYIKTLKQPFRWLGGFREFAVHLSKEYLEGGKYFNEDFEIPVTYRAASQKNAKNTIEKVFEKSCLVPDYITHDDVMSCPDSYVLATEVLSVTKIELPPLPGPGELMLRIRANRQRRAMDSEFKTAGTDLKRKATSSNSKREEVFLAANITLPPVPSVTGEVSNCEMLERDSNQGATVTLESLERQAMGTMKILKRKLSVMEKVLKPYPRYPICKKMINDLKREVFSSNSILNVKMSNSKRVTKVSDTKVVKASDSKKAVKSSDMKSGSTVSKPKTIKKSSDPKAVPKASDPKVVMKVIEPKAVVEESETKEKDLASDSKGMGKSSDSKRVAKLSSKEAFVKPNDPKFVKESDPNVVKTSDPNVVKISDPNIMKTSDSKFVVKLSNPSSVEKASDPKTMAKVTKLTAVVKSDSNNEVKAIYPPVVAKASDTKAIVMVSYSNSDVKASDPKAVVEANDPKLVTDANSPKAEANVSKAVTEANNPKVEAEENDPKAIFDAIAANSQAFEVVKQKMNTAWWESIVHRVIKHNKSNRSYLSETNKRIMKEAEETLEHLKNIILSLIKVLDKYDEE